jgi:hypothetical protein
MQRMQGWGTLRAGEFDLVGYLALRRRWNGTVSIGSLSPPLWGGNWRGVLLLRGIGLLRHWFHVSQLCNGALVVHFEEVWHANIPTKIKIFLWQMIKCRLLSNDNSQGEMGPRMGVVFFVTRRKQLTTFYFIAIRPNLCGPALGKCLSATGIRLGLGNL